jgi:hypothetical protein
VSAASATRIGPPDQFVCCARRCELLRQTLDEVLVASMTQLAALLFLFVIAGLGVFQIALAAGAPLGRFAWGGAQAKLPAALRIGSVVSLFIYGACAAMIADRAGLIDVVADDVSRIGAFVVAGFLSLGVVMNAISRSKPERFTMTPVAFVLASSAWVVALGL